MKRTLIIFLMLLAMAFPALSQAAGEGGERILDYAVTARVEEDASLVVTERITVSIAHLSREDPRKRRRPAPLWL